MGITYSKSILVYTIDIDKFSSSNSLLTSNKAKKYDKVSKGIIRNL